MILGCVKNSDSMQKVYRHMYFNVLIVNYYKINTNAVVLNDSYYKISINVLVYSFMRYRRE
jgi:hypothetical protein